MSTKFQICLSKQKLWRNNINVGSHKRYTANQVQEIIQNLASDDCGKDSDSSYEGTIASGQLDNDSSATHIDLELHDEHLPQHQVAIKMQWLKRFDELIARPIEMKGKRSLTRYFKAVMAQSGFWLILLLD